VVIGEKTFGKGVIQFFFRMKDGSGIKLTVAKYLTPNYHDISREGGIEPDMQCRDHPRGLLPSADGKYDECIMQGMRYLQSHPIVGTPLLQALQ
jgi:carboxyl-terminal processing protease